MNTYLIKSKVELMRESAQALEQLGVTSKPFTKKIFYYFTVHNGLKYVHRKSLRFIYTNADTWTSDRDPDHCAITKQITPIDIERFLTTTHSELIPRMVSMDDNFFVYEYFDGIPVDSITSEEFWYLKEQDSLLDLTPFYNSMTYNMVRSAGGIKLIDLKHFDRKLVLPFFVYMYNSQNGINTLYVEDSVNIERIFEHLSVDYPIESATVIEYKRTV